MDETIMPTATRVGAEKQCFGHASLFFGLGELSGHLFTAMMTFFGISVILKSPVRRCVVVRESQEKVRVLPADLRRS